MKAVPLSKGEAAPFTGQLMTPTLAVALSTGVALCREKAKLTEEYVGITHRLELQHVNDLSDIEARTLKAKLKVVNLALEQERELKEIPFWEEPFFVGSVAFAAGAAVAVGVAYSSVWAWQQVATSL